MLVENHGNHTFGHKIDDLPCTEYLKFCHSKPPWRGIFCCCSYCKPTKHHSVSIQSFILVSWICENILRGAKGLITKKQHWINSIHSVLHSLSSFMPWTSFEFLIYKKHSTRLCGRIKEELVCAPTSILLCSGKDIILMIADIWITIHTLRHISICIFNFIFLSKLGCNIIMWLDH